MARLIVDKLSYSVPRRKILDDVSFMVDKGESVAVAGPSGSGKSTLLMCLLGLLEPNAGSIYVDGEDIIGMSRHNKVELRRKKLGMVFQFGELLPELTPVENVALPGLLAGKGRATAYKQAQELLERLAVPADETPTSLLSGGERQRTAVARALVTQPSVMLADEPTGALDAKAREEVADLLFNLAREHQCAMVVVTHDLTVARRANRQFRLESARLTEVAVSAR